MVKRTVRAAAKWMLLAVASVAVTGALTALGVPSAGLFAALVVGIVLALSNLAPAAVPRRMGIAAQGVLGVYIGTMVSRDAIGALGPHWPLVLGIALATLLVSVLSGILLGLRRDVSPLTGSLAMVAGGASGLVAIARELGADDRVVAVVQYLRVALVTASMPIAVTLIYRAERAPHAMPADQPTSVSWYLNLLVIAVLALVGGTAAKLIRLPGAGLLGPLALTVAVQLSGTSFAVSVPAVLVQIGYLVIGWQAGVAFTRASLRAVGRTLPAAVALIVALSVATAGLGVLLARLAGLTPLEGYLATSPGGVYAVLATAVETGSNVTFIIAAQVVRILLMLFAAPLMARAIARVSDRWRPRAAPAAAVDHAAPGAGR